jgi:hypothetical protein
MKPRDDAASFGFAEGACRGGSHVCLIYDSEAERRWVMANFFRAGLAAGEDTVYFADSGVQETIEWLALEGVPAGAEVAEGCVRVLSAEAAYYPHGYFSAEDTIGRVRSLSRDAEERGYSVLRGTGEVGWVTRGVRGSEEHLEYEVRVTPMCQECTVTALCQFDARLWEGQALFNMLRVHPRMMVRGQVMENPYYLTPEEFYRERGLRS